MLRRVGLLGAVVDERVETEEMRSLDGGIRPGVAIAVSFERSLYEREAEVTSDEDEWFREGECEK